MEVLLGLGEIDDVIHVVVNDFEIPQSVSGKDMTATGWYTVVSRGGRNGTLNADFQDGAGHSLGDPYGSMALLSVVVPNRISNGVTLPRVQVLIRGLRMERGQSG